MPAALEHIWRVHITTEDAFLEIGDSPDNPNYLEIRTTDALSKSWFGSISMPMTTEYAEALGNALIAAAKVKLGK